VPISIPNTFSPGGVIFASQFNANFSSIKSWGDAHEVAVNGVHGVTTGAIVGTDLTQTLTNKTLTAPKIASGDFIFDETGAKILGFARAASAVNYIEINNSATGNSALLKAKGTDTNVFLELQTKGTGGFFFTNDSGKILSSISGGTTVVNYLAQAPSATGTSPSFSAVGSDTNLDLVLNPKGTGTVKSGTATLLRTDTYNESTYSNGTSLALGTSADGAFADVSTANAQITFTVNVPGRFKVEFEFTVNLGSGAVAATNVVEDLLRLTDGTTNSSPVRVKTLNNVSVATINEKQAFPVHLIHVFNFTTTGSKTVKLQKKCLQYTNGTDNFIDTDSATCQLVMRAYRITE